MAENFYQRLTRLFRSGPALRKKLIHNNLNSFGPELAAQNDVGYYSGYAYKREQNQMSVMGSYGIYNRSARYLEFREMEYCLHPDTKIAIPGGYKTIKELSELYKKNEEFIVYSYDHNKKEIVPAFAKNARPTKICNSYKVVFDNGKEIIGSDNHRLMKRDGTFCEIKDLKIGDSMMPFYRKALISENKIEKENEYLYIYIVNKNKSKSGWKSEHRIIAEWFYNREIKNTEVVHHINFKANDNRPENLLIMDKFEHESYHANLNNKKKWNYEINNVWIENFKKNHSKWMKENNPAERKDITFGKILELSLENDFNCKKICKILDTDPNTIKRKLLKNGYKNFEIFAKAYNKNWKSHKPLYGSKNSNYNNLVTFQKICDLYNVDNLININSIAKKLKTCKQVILSRIKEEGFRNWNDFKKNYQNCKIASIEFYEKDIQLYDLTVDGYKNFATDSVISHNTPELSTALDLYAEESCSQDEKGRTFHVYSDNPDILRELEILFYDICNIEFELKPWVRNFVKYGDLFLYVELLPNLGVTKIQEIVVDQIEREEGFDPNDIDAVRFKVQDKNSRYLENWQVLHFRLRGNELFYPYGCCHEATTKILTDKGIKEIKDINTNDYVMSFDLKTQEKQISKVLATKYSGKKTCLRIKTKHSQLTTTKEHQILTVDSKGNFIYKSAGSLKIGDRFIINKEQCKLKQIKKYNIPNRLTDNFIIEPIVSINSIIEKKDTYDIYVENENHNFYANNIVTHNSVLEHSRKLWRTFIMLEDAMLIYRIIRAPDRLIYYIDTSGIPATEVPNYMEQIKQSMRTNNAIDRINGRTDQRHMPISVEENLYIPTRPNNLSKVENLVGGTNSAAIEDIEYIHKRLTASTKIPRSFLGFSDTLGNKGSISMEDIRFARIINNMQKVIIAELNQLAILHLYAKGFTGEDLVNFQLKLSNPSTVAIQAKLNVWNLKFDTASKAKESALVDEEWIQREILELNSDQIINIRIGKEKDQIRNKTLEALEPPDPSKYMDDVSIVDPFDPSNYENIPTSTNAKLPAQTGETATAFGKLQGGPRRDEETGESKGYVKPEYAPISINNFVDMDRVKGRFKEGTNNNLIYDEKLLETIVGFSTAKKLKGFNKKYNFENRYIDISLLKEDQEEVEVEIKDENNNNLISIIED